MPASYMTKWSPLAVADFSMGTGTLEEEEPHPPLARVGGSFTNLYDANAWTGDIQAELSRTVRSCTTFTSELRWIPLMVLYIYYQLTFECVGPLKIGRGWVEHRTRPYLDAGQFPHATRLRWFQGFLAAFRETLPDSPGFGNLQIGV